MGNCALNATNRTHSDGKLRYIKLLNELKSATPRPTEAKRNMAVKTEVFESLWLNCDVSVMYCLREYLC